MSKLPKHKHNINARRRIKYRKKLDGPIMLMKGHNKRIQLLGDYFHKEALQNLSLMISKASADLYCHALISSRVSLYDYKIFDTYIEALQCYLNVSTFYTENKGDIQDGQVEAILSGLHLVITSRLQDNDLYEDSPIENEKTMLLKEVIQLFFADIEKLITEKFQPVIEHINEMVYDLPQRMDSAILKDRYLQMYEILSDLLMDSIYKAYADNLSLAVFQLDNLDNRGVLTGFQHSLKQEIDILESIIKVQVKELEKYNDDELVVQKILSMIRQTYQVVKKNASDIDKLCEKAYHTQIQEPVVFDIFNTNIKEFVFSELNGTETSCDSLLAEYEKCQSFIEKKMKGALLKVISTLTENGTKEEILQNLSYSSAQNQHLCDNILASFNSILMYTERNHLEYESLNQEAQIISGIKETIDIKMISLKENLDVYHKEISIIQADLEAIEPGLDGMAKNIEKEMPGIMNRWHQKYRGYIEINEVKLQEAEKVLEDMAEDLSAEAREMVQKNLLKANEKLNRKELAFKKESLLFEISTFDEIIYYSVSRLKECEQMSVKEYVNMIEAVDFEIKEYLSNAGISLINPKPHELFNGKEHEVLMAESMDGYEKGQIIKVSNCGYKQGDTVILRANVIAAR